MSKLKLDYSFLSSVVTEAKRASSELSDYRSNLESLVASKLSSLPGRDSYGYIGNAQGSVRRKETELQDAKNRFADFSKRVEMLTDDARAADKRVAGQIKETGGSYVGKRNWFQKAGDWIYGTFCVDLPSTIGFGDFIGDTVGWVKTRVTNGLEDIRDWFKYKEGKYVLNTIKSVKAFIASVAAVAAAAVAVSFATPFIAVVTTAALGAACVLMVTTAVNYKVSFDRNLQAYETAQKGELGKARYQGGTTGYLEYTKRTDFGGKEINSFMEFTGETFDKVEKRAQEVKLVTGILMVGAKTDPDTGSVKEISLEQAKKNIKESFGFKRERYSLDKNGRKIPYNGEKSGYKYQNWSLKNFDPGSMIKKLIMKPIDFIKESVSAPEPDDNGGLTFSAAGSGRF